MVDRQADWNERALTTDDLMSDLGARTVRGGAIGLVGRAAALVIQLAQLAVMSRLLAPADFGLVAMATTVTTFVMIFRDMGLAAAIVQRDQLNQNTVSGLFYLNIGVGLLVMLAAWALAPLGAILFSDVRVAWLIAAMAFTVPITALGGVHGALLQRRMRWLAILCASLSSQLAGLVAGTFAALTLPDSDRFWALVIAAWTSAIVITGMLWMLSLWRPSLVRNWTDTKQSFGFGAYLTGFNVVNYFHRQLDNVLIGWRFGGESLGHYSRAYTLLTLPINLFNSAVVSAVYPALSRLQNHPNWRQTYLNWLSVTVLATSALTVVLAVNGELLVSLLLGPQWSLAQSIFTILVFSIVPSTICNTSGWIYMSLGQTRRMLYCSLPGILLFVIAIVLGLPFGPIGVAVAYSIASWIWFPVCFVFASGRAPVQFVEIVRAVLPTALACLLITGFAKFVMVETSIWVELLTTAIGVILVLVAWIFSPFRFPISRLQSVLSKLVVLSPKVPR